jgi:hypothetical protein
MKLGNIEIKLGANELVLGSVVLLTFSLLFVSPPKDSTDLFKLGFTALIAWGAGYAMGKTSKGETKG